MRRRTTTASDAEEQKLEQDEKFPKTACCSKLLSDAMFYYLDAMNNVHDIGRGWVCVKCRKPVARNGVSMLKWPACPEDFDQVTWESIKSVGWVHRQERGGAFYVARDAEGKLGAIGHGSVVVSKAVRQDLYRMIGNTHQPDEVLIEDEEVPF